MKKIFFISSIVYVLALSGCDHCMKLSQYNFNYLPLLQENYCYNDLACENFLKEISFNYLSGNILSNPCMHEGYQSECASFSIKICSDILKSTCSNNFLAPKSSSINYFYNNQENLSRFDIRDSETEKEMKQEISRQKQKYLGILNILNNIELGI